MEEGRLFFLGAGFSAHAGVPLTSSLLPQALALFRDEASGLYERITTYASDVDIDLNQAPNAEDFARFCTYLDFLELREHAGGERWSSDGSRERVALKFFLAKAIAIATPSDVPQCYLQFTQGLNANDVIITFNWDLLLEKALKQTGKAYSYNYEDGKIQLLKMHGSINWILGAPRPMVSSCPDFEYQPLGYATPMHDVEVFSSEMLYDHHAWQKSKALIHAVKPLLILPGYGKAVDVRLLSPLWYRPEFLNIRKGGISIIGLSVSNDDYIMDSLFRYLLRDTQDLGPLVRVINPDDSAGLKFQKIVGEGRQLDLICRNFDEETLQQALLQD